MANTLLKFGNHFLKNTSGKLISRDIQTGHIYEKVKNDGVEKYILQQFVPKENLAVSTMDLYDFIPSPSLGLLILSAHSDGWVVKASSTNNSVANENVTIGDFNDAYHHHYTFSNCTLYAGLSYLIAINRPTNAWLPESDKMYGYFAVKMDGQEIDSTETWVLSDWLSNLPQLRNAEVGTNVSSLGGFDLTRVANRPQAFIMINDKNILELRA